MRKIILIILIAFISTNSFSQNTDKDLVLESFEIYKNAILNDKGEIAVNQVDSRTIKYYTQILEKIKTADSTEINSMGIIDKLTLLSVRHRASIEDILSFDGRGLFEYAIKEGMVGKNSVINASLAEVVTNGDFAKAEFVVNEQKTSFYFHFYKEENVWKIDITHLFPIGSMSLKQVIKDSGETENDFILNILEALTGKKPSDEIWNSLI